MKIYLNILFILLLTECLYVIGAPIESDQSSNNSSDRAVSNSTQVANVTKHGTKQRPKADSRFCGDMILMDCGFLQT